MTGRDDFCGFDLANNSEHRRMRLMLSLRRSGVTDRKVLGVMENLDREVFLPEAFKTRAFEDTALPIGHHQTISQPSVVGLMTQALRVEDRHKVLEVGTGSGYQACVLAPLCRRLYTVERLKSLAETAEERFHRFKLANVTTRVGDGSLGWREQAPFDRIMVTAGAADIPGTLLEQLVAGGVMVVPVDALDGPHQRLLRVVRTDEGAEVEDLLAVRFVPLIGDGEGA